MQHQLELGPKRGRQRRERRLGTLVEATRKKSRMLVSHWVPHHHWAQRKARKMGTLVEYHLERMKAERYQIQMA